MYFLARTDRNTMNFLLAQHVDSNARSHSHLQKSSKASMISRTMDHGG